MIDNIKPTIRMALQWLLSKSNYQVDKYGTPKSFHKDAFDIEDICKELQLTLKNDVTINQEFRGIIEEDDSLTSEQIDEAMEAFIEQFPTAMAEVVKEVLGMGFQSELRDMSEDVDATILRKDTKPKGSSKKTLERNDDVRRRYYKIVDTLIELKGIKVEVTPKMAQEMVGKKLGMDAKYVKKIIYAEDKPQKGGE
jgi:hypothetical protein